MDREIMRSLVAVAICIAMALMAACSKNEPASDPEVSLISFSYEKFEPQNPSDDNTDKKWVTVNYSAESGRLSVRWDYTIIPGCLPKDIRGLATSENDVISVGFSMPKPTGPLPDCFVMTSMIWDMRVKGHGKRLIGIHNLGYFNGKPTESQFKKSILLTTIEVDLERDFSGKYEIELSE